ncbi:hypothetical protein NG799_11985 [Laspinema sp. D1]|uniref:Uncharacterized protein n=1 Tax=Laspinema palackyanum D2a TaxID=2953684 RepID=A0ABT2MUF0_9CYAN|nr:hypothetical protein [Laspinema sp. D2b]MCT7967057.1 hypothetical protein [Laspinema sp. D2a]
MLDISFYTEGQEPHSIEMKEDFFEWLAHTNFSRIGKSHPTVIKIEEEKEELLLIKLDPENRQLLKYFLRDAIILESEKIIENLGDAPSKEDYQKVTYPLKKLHELRRCVENETYQYLQRA